MRMLALAAATTIALAGCDEKKPTATAEDAAPPPVVTASATAAASAPAAASSPAPAASASAAPAAATKDVSVTVKDPDKETSKTVKALVGGTVVLYLPRPGGTTWTVSQFDKPLGKAKEETLPGFAGPVPAASFTWKLDAPGLKAGQTLKATLQNKDKAGATKTFALTIELS